MEALTMKDSYAKLDGWIEAELPSKLAVERRNKLEEVRKNLARRDYGRVKEALEAASNDGDEGLAADIRERIDQHEAKRACLENPAHKLALKEERAQRKLEEKIEAYVKSVAVGLIVVSVIGSHLGAFEMMTGVMIGGSGAVIFVLSELIAAFYVDFISDQMVGRLKLLGKKREHKA